MKLPHVSLLGKILLSTSLALTVLFGITAFLAQRSLIDTASKSLDDEVKASFRAYDSLWKSRAEQLATISKVLSTMSDVRAAFGTGDRETIRDTAGEIWSRISQEGALFLVTDPAGHVIASLGDRPGTLLSNEIPQVRSAALGFPKQATGFIERNGQLAQIVITPVYVDSGAGPALLNVLVAGFNVDDRVASRLKEATGGSDFLFVAGGRPITTTLPPLTTAEFIRRIPKVSTRTPDRVRAGGVDFVPLVTPLIDIEGKPVGQLWILRSFESAQQRLTVLQRQMVLIWLCVLTAGLLVTSLLARRIVRPIVTLDAAAGQISRQNYDVRVPVESRDELGRLGETFNAMCDSIQQARSELIRNERISTIARLSTSIVHDLRSPLAAIYGGAEMLVDQELSRPQMNRLATNMYKASRQIQDLLQDLVNVARGKTNSNEVCRLSEIVNDAWSSVANGAEDQRVRFSTAIPDAINVSVERNRIQRAFVNLMENSVEAMSSGGELRVSATTSDSDVTVVLEDTGPGISPRIRTQLFQPFVTAGKKNGLGLGLVLSRQAALDNGGDMWTEDSSTGARFFVRLPLVKSASAVGTGTD